MSCTPLKGDKRLGVLVDNAAKMKSQQVIAYFATLQLRNPDSMKGIRRGSTPPVGQKVRDSLLIIATRV